MSSKGFQNASKLNGIVSVLEFGAVGDGVTDDTAAIQAAVNTGKVVYFPAGIYAFSSQITIQNGGICGASFYTTFLKPAMTSGNAILLNGTNPCFFSNFSMLGGSMTYGNGVYVNGGGGATDVAHHVFQNMEFFEFPTAINFNVASQWAINNCQFINCKSNGLIVANVVNEDSGDSYVSGCQFVSIYNTCNHISYKSSGGLRVANSKFNNGGSGIKLAFASTKDTGTLLINCNSFENQEYTSISFENNGSTKTFERIAITGNNFLLTTPQTGQAAIACTDASLFLRNLTISGNSFQLFNNTGTGVALNYVSGYNISGNTFLGTGTGNTTVGIQIGSSAAGKVGSNTYGRNAQAVNTTLLISGSGNSYSRDFIQTGVATVAATSVFSSYFYGTATITLPVATTAQITPGDITVYSGTGSIIGINVYGVTNSGNSTVSFDVQVISLISQSASIQWQVRSV
jgi:hypothetical protein